MSRAANPEPAIFVHRIVASPHDTDELGHVSNVAYVRWIQDAARAHSTHVGWGYERYLELGAVFVVRRHEIDYLGTAFAGDAVELTTWVADWSAVCSFRHTRIRRVPEDVDLVRAVTTWAFVATATRRPRRIAAALREAFSSPAPP
ncbi:MAG: acyl-CoA thioesterase [Deltaproteobacteria bacterium]|nr:acyl-CoA thioesterase [Deltaproteobacteria bacterium]